MVKAGFLKRYQEVLLHGIFWTGYFLFEWLNSGAYFDNYEQSLFFITLNIPLLIFAGYWHLNSTIRHFLLSGKIVGFWISLLTGILGFGILRRMINYVFYYPHYFQDALLKPLWYWPKILGESMHLHLVAGLFVAACLVRHAVFQQRLNEKYLQEKLSAEYRLLQSQVQPHFLFNTLNNLTSISLHNPALIPDMLQRLARLISYQLHESHRQNVSIGKELEYLTDYISLEKIRYGDRLDVQTNFRDVSGMYSMEIPPLLLLPFVENAFKHGAAQIEGKSWIHIQLYRSVGQIVFSVENAVSEEEFYKPTTGLGLENLRKRLEILFPGSHELLTLKEAGQFLAVLKFKIV